MIHRQPQLPLILTLEILLNDLLVKITSVWILKFYLFHVAMTSWSAFQNPGTNSQLSFMAVSLASQINH